MSSSLFFCHIDLYKKKKKKKNLCPVVYVRFALIAIFQTDSAYKYNLFEIISISKHLHIFFFPLSSSFIALPLFPHSTPSFYPIFFSCSYENLVSFQRFCHITCHDQSFEFSYFLEFSFLGSNLITLQICCCGVCM